MAVVNPIGRGNDRGRSDARDCEQCVGIAKAMAGRDAVGDAETFEPIWSRVGDRHYPESVGVIEGPLSVNEMPALTSSNEDRVGHELATQGTA